MAWQRREAHLLDGKTLDATNSDGLSDRWSHRTSHVVDIRSGPSARRAPTERRTGAQYGPRLG